MTVLAAFTLAAVATYLLRSSLILLSGSSDSPRLTKAIRFVAPAVLAAIVASAVFLDRGALRQPALAELVAIGAGLVAVRRTGNVGMALFVGLPVFWAVSALIS
jgi:branched-subunit amino acid transport protein